MAARNEDQRRAGALRDDGPCSICGRSLAELAAEVRLLRAELGALRDARRDVLNLDEAADLLGVSRRSVERWIAQGKLKVAKLTPGRQGTVRLQRAEVERFVKERTRG